MANNKKYFWLKFKEDFFRDKKIKKLRKIAGGDTFTIIYLKIQLLSLKNGGDLYFEGVEDTFAEEIALEIDEDEDNVKVTLAFLIKNGLIEQIDEDTFSLIETKQCIGVETASTIRSRKSRALKNEQKALQCNTNATICNTEIDIEKDLEKKKEIDIDNRNKVPYEKIKDLFHEICVSYPKVMKLNDVRKKTIKARYLEYNSDIEVFRKLFTKAEESNFLKGNNDNNWSASFDWLLKPQNMIKVLEGNYENKKQTFTKKPVREEIVPEWLNQKIEKEEMTPEELAEMEELMKPFKEEYKPNPELQKRLKEKYRKKQSL